MPATTSRGYPYPTGPDGADGPADLQSLAAGIDTDISANLPDMAVTSFGDIGAFIAAAYGTSTLPSTNYASVAVIRPKVDITPTKFVWWCAVQDGNYDIGIIDVATRSRLWSLGSTACPATGEQEVPIVAGPTLSAGTRYGLVIASSSAVFEFDSSSLSAGMSKLYDGTIAYGVVSASFPIPATLGVWSETTSPAALALRA